MKELGSKEWQLFQATMSGSYAVISNLSLVGGVVGMGMHKMQRTPTLALRSLQCRLWFVSYSGTLAESFEGLVKNPFLVPDPDPEFLPQ